MSNNLIIPKKRRMPIVWVRTHRVSADQVDASGHWQGNTRREVYGSKIPKAVRVLNYKINNEVNPLAP